MINLSNRNNISSEKIKLGIRFSVTRGGRTRVFKIINHSDIPGKFSLMCCDEMGNRNSKPVFRDELVYGCSSVEECIQQAFDFT